MHDDVDGQVRYQHVTSFSVVGSCQITGPVKNVNHAIKARKYPYPKENKNNNFFSLEMNSKFLRVGRGRIRGTSNSRKIQFGGAFASLLKLTIESHCTEGCSRSNK